MSSLAYIAPNIASPRKRSKHDLKLIEQQQEKINLMIRGFYDKTKGKLTKALTKCQNKNTLLCRQLFDSLAMHPNQQLYQTARLHDLIFNEIDLISQTVADFVRRLDSLQERLSGEVTLQQERSWAKRENGGEKGIAVLRKVSFKREKHALKQRLVGVDTVNRKLLKCQGVQQEGQHQQQGIRFDMQGKTAEPIILAYSKVWFQSKRRQYLFCLGSHQAKTQFYLFNDKLQAITTFPHPVPIEPPLSIIQLGQFLYLLSPHKITRINLINQEDSVCRCFSQRLIRGQAYEGGVILWVASREVNHQHSLFFLDSQLDIYCQTDLKMNVTAIPTHFKLRDTLFFLTKTYNGVIEVLRVQECEAVAVGDAGALEEVIPVRVGNITEEIIFRLAGNKFLKMGEDGRFIGLEVDIDQGESIKNCAVLGEHFYALIENGKAMLECHYVPPNPNPS